MINRGDREPAGQVETLPDEIIVKISPDATQEGIKQARDSLGATLVETTAVLGLERWSLPEDASGKGFDLGATLDDRPPGDAIEYMQANRVYSVSRTVTDDPDLGLLWGLDNQGQTGGVADADIDAPEAWDQATGSGVVVAVIDTGIDLTHPDLDDNLWSNPGEIAGNGLDDDGNGYVDDIHGYDFVNEDADPNDDYSHGTHVAGTIAAEAGNGQGIAGVARDARLMAVKAFDSAGFANEFDLIQAIEYAALEGADISNHSWASYEFSQGINDAIRLAAEQGQLFVAAAGNESNDNDAVPVYPASFDLDNVISVAATTASDTLAWFSNFGATTVDLGAPGEGIYSTLPGNGYGYLDGTSMATPHVSGAAALLLSQDPGLSAGELKSALLGTADPVADLAGRTVTGGRLNAAAALAASGPPVEITGTDGDDDLTGTAGRDIIHGLAGDDTIQGLQGSDEISGGSGRDFAAGGAGNDTIRGDSGNDSLFGEEGADTLFGGTDNGNWLNGDGFDGSAGGLNTLEGGNGSDRLYGARDRDLLIGGTGADTLVGNDGDDTLRGDTGTDHLNGGRGDDLLIGGAGNDTLECLRGSDTLMGGAGDDVILTAPGAGLHAQLYGEDGADSFVFRVGRGDGWGTAVIHDFQIGLDRLVIEGIGDLAQVLHSDQVAWIRQVGADVKMLVQGDYITLADTSLDLLA